MAPQPLVRPQPTSKASESALDKSQTGPKPPTLVRSWLREPLLHFLFAGALIFASYQLLNPTANPTDRTNQIALTKDDLRQLAVHWLGQGRPLPTVDQTHALIEQGGGE